MVQLPDLLQKYIWLACDLEPQGFKIMDSNYFTSAYIVGVSKSNHT